MAINMDSGVYLINFILSLIIVIIGYSAFKLNRGKVTLFISIAFSGFALTHLMTMFGLQTTMEYPIIALRIASYCMIIIGLYVSWKSVKSQLQEFADKNRQLEADMAEKQRLEAERKDAEGKYRAVFENSIVAMSIIEDDMTVSFFNNECARITGYTLDTGVKPISILDYVHPDDMDIVKQYHVMRRENPEKTPPTYEVRFIDTGGVVRNILMGISLIPGTKKSVASFIDITENKRLREIERKSEEMYRIVFDNVLIGMAIVDKNLKIKLINTETERISGYNKTEIESKMSISTVLTVEEFERFKVCREHLLTSGTLTPLRADTRLKCKDGTFKDVVISINSISDSGDVLVSLLDITDRKRNENEIKASLKEKEVLIKEVHHRVKNNLQIVSSLLNLQSGYLMDDRDLEMFNESQNRVRSMALVHEKLYRSNDLNQINLRDYAMSLVENLNVSYNPKPDCVNVKVDIGNIFMDVEKGIPCGLIVNEIVSNGFKYAFPGDRKGEILLSVTADESNLKMLICDDGIGLPQNFEINKLKSLGMQIVVTLTEQLDGELTITSEPDHGTTFEITFPR